MNATVYGSIKDAALVIVIFVSLFLVYICKNPIRITKYVNNGVIPFKELSAALNTTCENSGVKELCINIGTIIGDSIAHFVDEAGTKRLDIATMAKVINIRAMPDSLRVLIEFAM